MRIDIQPLRIDKRPENQVTSSQVFKKNQRRVSDDYKYDENGLFSRKIFGRIGSCECGHLKEPGYCEICGCRVVDKFNMPEFFIDLGVMVPKLYVDYGKYRDVKDILAYKAFLYRESEDAKWQILSDEDNEFDPEKFDREHTRIGLDAARELHPDIDEWAERNMTDFVNVPHPLRRSNIRLSSKKILITPLNKALILLLQNIERVNQFKEVFEGVEGYSPERTYFMLAFYSEIYDQYIECMKEIFKLFTSGKQSFIGSNMRSRRTTGAIKGTMVNRFDIDEDIILIGDTFIQTLFPYLYKHYDGDMEKINSYLVENDCMVLLNRPPTICHLSIMGMRPRVASCYKRGTFTDGAIGKNHKSEYDEEIDTIGIRTLGINPIITDGIAGDFDGDCGLCIAIYSEEARKEAESMLPSKNYMNYANGEIRNKIPEDIVYSDWSL